MSVYKHKNIQFGMFQNEYLLRNEETMPLLIKIYEGEIPYSSDFYPLLIQNFERLYKGVCVELQKIHSDSIKYHQSDYATGHYFTAYATTISHFIPLSDTREGHYNVLNKIRDLEKAYTPARYNDNYTLEEFRSDFRRYETQTNRLYIGLSKQLSKIQEEELDDLSDW